MNFAVIGSRICCPTASLSHPLVNLRIFTMNLNGEVNYRELAWRPWYLHLRYDIYPNLGNSRIALRGRCSDHKLIAHFWVNNTQQNSYSISHWDYKVTRHSDSVLIVANCRQHSDYTAISSSVTKLQAVSSDDFTVTVQSPCSHYA